MISDHLTGIEQYEAKLWKAADNLWANSNLASDEYFMPILGLIFLRHVTNRYYEVMAAIEEDRAAAGCRIACCRSPVSLGNALYSP